MLEANLKTRIVHKHDLEVNWIKAGNAANPFIPKQAEIIVYDIELDANGNTLELPAGRIVAYDYPRFKIGDGINNVNDLPFSIERNFENFITDETGDNTNKVMSQKATTDALLALKESLEEQIANLLEVQNQLQTKVNELYSSLEWGRF